MVQRKQTKPRSKGKGAPRRKSRAIKPQSKVRTRSARPRARQASAAQVGTLSLFQPEKPLEGAPPHILIFLPGWLGSKLADENETVWFDVTTIPAHGGIEGWLNALFDKMLNPQIKLHAVEVMQDIFGPLPFQQQYGRLKRMLEDWGYEVLTSPADAPAGNPPKLLCYFFPYDWRQDNRKSAQDLKDAVDMLRLRHPDRQIWLMGHSGGGIVSRWYLEKLGGNDIVKRLFLLASPWDGAPSILYYFIHGFHELFGIQIDEFDIPHRTSEALRSFPSAYQILPQARNFIYGANGQDVSPFEDTAWVTAEQQKAMLEDGRAFNRELGNSLHVETIAYIGYNKATRTEGRLLSADATRWGQIRWKDTDLVGDGTVPLYSSEYADARRFYVIAEHSDIYVNEDLQKRLKRQLLTGGTGDEGGVLGFEEVGTDAAIEIEPRSPKPGERVHLTVVLTERDLEPRTDKSPVTTQFVAARSVRGAVHWLQGLPLSPNTAPVKMPRPFQFRADPQMTGRYHATFQAPAQEGYYELETTIAVADQPEFTLRSTILVQAPSA